MKKILFCLLGISLISVFQNCSRANFNSGTQEAASVAGADVLSTGTARICPQLSCVAPPENCHYEQVPSASAKCATSCGNLVCKGPHICPMIMCVEPPKGCVYAGSASARDANGCNIGCGPLICDSTGVPPVVEPPIIKPPVICPKIACVEPPKGCVYAHPDKDKDGCDAGCGAVICSSSPPVVEPPIKPPVHICPAIACAAPPEGCAYVPKPQSSTGESPCGCGDLVCKPKPTPGPVQPPICDSFCPAPPTGCNYDVKPQNDNRGCPITCGHLLCTSPGPVPPIQVPPPIKPPVICPAVDYICPLPAARNCHYDGIKRVDENGCHVGCGHLICEELPANN